MSWHPFKNILHNKTFKNEVIVAAMLYSHCPGVEQTRILKFLNKKLPLQMIS